MNWGIWDGWGGDDDEDERDFKELGCGMGDVFCGGIWWLGIGLGLGFDVDGFWWVDIDCLVFFLVVRDGRDLGIFFFIKVVVEVEVVLICEKDDGVVLSWILDEDVKLVIMFVVFVYGDEVVWEVWEMRRVGWKMEDMRCCVWVEKVEEIEKR